MKGLALAKPSRRRQALLDAVRAFSAIDRYTVGQKEMGLLVTGLSLVCCWRYLAALVEGFEARGPGCLWEIWGFAVAAFVLGQVAKWCTPPQPEAQPDEELELVAPEQQHGSSSSSLKGHLKEGQELTVVTPSKHAAAAAAAAAKAEGLLQVQQQEEEEEDMATVKRRAQEEAAAKLATYRAEVQQLLDSIRRGAASSSPVDAQLYRLADQLFASSINLSEFVLLGGVPVVTDALRALTRSLTAAQRQQPHAEIEEEQQQVQQGLQAVQAAALPSMLQASWVLLQLAQGSPACRSALQEPPCSAALLAAAQAISGLPPAAARATEAILRNLWWTLLYMCDTAAPRSGSGSSSTPQQQQQQQQPVTSAFQAILLQQYQEAGAVPMLQQLLSLQHGISAGWVAAAHLGLLMQLGHHQQQQQGQQGEGDVGGQQQQEGSSAAVLSSLSAAAVQAVLQEEGVTGLCYLMTQLRLEQPPAGQELHQQQLSGRMRVLVEGMLHYLLTFHSPQLLRQLIELQLLGSFAAHSSARLGRLLVCQLLSSKGQEVMAAAEEGYEVDVPLALAHVIPLRVHVRLPAPPQQPAAGGKGGQQATAAVQPQPQQQEQHAGRPQPVSDDLFTDILACRLLLQRERLQELLSAFAEELQAPPDPQAQQRQQLAASNAVAAAADAAAQECSVVSAVLALTQHLMSRDLQLQAAQHVRGDCMSVSASGSASSSSRSLDEALGMPDHSGAYTKVVRGMVAAERLPASSSGASASSTADLTLPAVADSAAVERGTRSGQFVFQFGKQQHAVDAAMLKRIKHCSQLVASILGGARSGPGPVTVLAIPQFTDEANCWVLQCLERWLRTGALEGFSVQQAAQLWVAADFLQVDGLQVACEDVVAAGFRADTQQYMPVALELCARHTESGGRLLRLLAQQLLHCVGNSRGARGRSGADASTLQDEAAGGWQLRLLRGLLEQHSGVLLPVVHAELRDRLVTLCMLNAGQDAEDPYADVA